MNLCLLLKRQLLIGSRSFLNIRSLRLRGIALNLSSNNFLLLLSFLFFFWSFLRHLFAFFLSSRWFISRLSNVKSLRWWRIILSVYFWYFFLRVNLLRRLFPNRRLLYIRLFLGKYCFLGWILLIFHS